MAALEGYKVEGLNQLVRKLQALGLDVDDLKESFAKIAREGAQVAAGFAPRRSGRLAANIRGNKAKNKAVVRAGGARVPYAGPINYGWPRRGIATQQFMQRADAVMGPRALGMLKQEIDSKIKSKGLD